MREEDRDQFAHDSIKKRLEATAVALLALWNLDAPPADALAAEILTLWEPETVAPGDALTALPMTERGFGNVPCPGFYFQILADGLSNPDVPGYSEALVRLEVLTRQDPYLNRYLRSRCFVAFGLRSDIADKVGYVPMYNFRPNPAASMPDGVMLVRDFEERGWTEIQHGEPERLLDDETVVHFVANLIFQY